MRHCMPTTAVERRSRFITGPEKDEVGDKVTKETKDIRDSKETGTGGQTHTTRRSSMPRRISRGIRLRQGLLDSAEEDHLRPGLLGLGWACHLRRELPGLVWEGRRRHHLHTTRMVDREVATTEVTRAIRTAGTGRRLRGLHPDHTRATGDPRRTDKVDSTAAVVVGTDEKRIKIEQS